MSDQFIRTLLRFLPASLWIVAAGVGVYQFMQTPGEVPALSPERTTLDKIFPYAFLMGALVCLRLAYREFRRAKEAHREEQRSDEARAKLLPRKPVDRQDAALPADLTVKLMDTLKTLETYGVLVTGEVNLETIAQEAAEIDEFKSMDLDDVLYILRGLTDRSHRPLQNIAFFPDSVEMFESEIFHYVEEFARLTHQEESLRRLRLQGIGGKKIEFTARDYSPTNNAQLEFEVGGVEQRVRFLMYAKSAPLGLMTRLAEVFASDGRCFVVANGDIKCITNVAQDAFNLLVARYPRELLLVQHADALPTDAVPGT